MMGVYVCVCVHDLRQAEVHSPLCLCLQVLRLEVCVTIPSRSAILEDYARKGWRIWVRF